MKSFWKILSQQILMSKTQDFMDQFEDALPLMRLKKFSKTKKNINKFKQKVFKKTFKDNSIYKGQKKGNLRHGFGKHKYLDGSVYLGEFKQGKRNGYGQFRDKIGNRYWGQFKNGYRHGKGKINIFNQYQYEGDFKQGKMHGIGKIVFIDGSSYEGNFEDGKWCGKGKYIDKNKKSYALIFDQKNRPQLKQIMANWEIFKQIKNFMRPCIQKMI